MLHYLLLNKEKGTVPTLCNFYNTYFRSIQDKLHSACINLYLHTDLFFHFISLPVDLLGMDMPLEGKATSHN
jgi:hypothetical protein